MAFVPPRLQRFTSLEERIEADERQVRKILEAVGVEQPAEMHAGWRPVGGDRDRLRGFPVVGPGIGGTAPGTDPVAALFRKERLQETTLGQRDRGAGSRNPSSRAW